MQIIHNMAETKAVFVIEMDSDCDRPLYRDGSVVIEPSDRRLFMGGVSGVIISDASDPVSIAQIIDLCVKYELDKVEYGQGSRSSVDRFEGEGGTVFRLYKCDW
jgi:hypothetical protein